MSNFQIDPEKFKRHDSLNTLCVNLTGLTADGIIIQDKDWKWLARRFAAAEALAYNQPEWVTNPTEALECHGKTFEDFKKTYEGIATPESCPSYTLAQVFAYIMDEPEAADTVMLDTDLLLKEDGYSRQIINTLLNRTYKEFAQAVAKAYLSLYSRKESPKQFLLGKVNGYSPLADVSSYVKYLAYMESRLCENTAAFIE
ncbi:MAG: hypothetical protein IJK26_09595 [Clostridia bacterium]|nr:hypothetical protein [Clostridia bacterium]